MTLQLQVRAFLHTQALFRPDALLLVAVSGGPDSLCLLHVLCALRATGGPALHVAHLDHGMRGEQAQAEAATVAVTAALWGVPITIVQRDVPALARTGGEGLQAAARCARYTFLATTALALGAAAVVVAHQANDQAETVLLHTLRGAGLTGLRGMRAVVPWCEWGAALGLPGAGSALIRPLLTTPRAEVTAYCAEHQLAPADDPSNRASYYARTRVRQLLPTLAAENPRLVAALGRTAQVCADDYDFIQTQLDAVWPRLVAAAPGALLLHRAVWQTLHPALQRYALRRATTCLGAAELSLAQIEAARAAAAQHSRPLGLGRDLRLEVDHAGLWLIRPGDSCLVDEPQLADERLPLVTPGSTTFGRWRCVVGTTAPESPGRWWVALDAATLDGPLMLRRRRPGDRFRPAGGVGSRKLQDFFVDRKLPRRLRAAWPILATPSAVVWVAGLRADARFLAGPATEQPLWVGLDGVLDCRFTTAEPFDP